MAPNIPEMRESLVWSDGWPHNRLRHIRTEERKPRIEDERWAASGLSTRSLSPVSIRGSAVRLTCGAEIDPSEGTGYAILADVAC